MQVGRLGQAKQASLTVKPTGDTRETRQAYLGGQGGVATMFVSVLEDVR